MTCNTFGFTKVHELVITIEYLLTLIKLLNPILEHTQSGLIGLANSRSERTYAGVIAAWHRYNSLARNAHDSTDLINNLSTMRQR